MQGITNLQAAVLQVLEWHCAMGVDCAVADVPTDWLAPRAAPFVLDAASVAAAGSMAAAAQVAAEQPQRSQPAPLAGARADGQRESGRRTFPTASPDTAQSTARDGAAAATSLEALQEALAGFDGCALKATAKNLCFYRGAARARLMVIGEAPGRDEDIEGRPFVGRAGRLLDKMLAAAGIGETEVHITNIVYWRPPGNRTPTPQEALVCRPFLERQIELVAPEFVVALGGAAAKHLLGVEDGIMRLRGRWRDVELASRQCRLMASLHPAYLLRTPAHKRLAWRDILAVSAALTP